MKAFSEAKKAKLLAKVEELKNSGLSTSAAIKKAGVTYNSYKRWTEGAGTGEARAAKVKTKRPYNRAVPQLISLDLPNTAEAQPVVIIMGRPEDVNKALSHLAAIKGL